MAMYVRTVTAILLAGATTALLAEVRRRETLRFDHGVLASLRGRGPRRVRRIADVIDRPSAVLVQAAVVGLLVGRKNPRLGACIFAAPALALGASNLLKHAFHRDRPLLHLFQREGRHSFPSGHTAGKGALVWIVANALPAPPVARALATLLAAADIALVGAARVAESAHWPTDTLAGAAIGIASAEAISCCDAVPGGS
jgi:undecaprenyl-diphosphatase